MEGPTVIGANGVDKSLPCDILIRFDRFVYLAEKVFLYAFTELYKVMSENVPDEIDTPDVNRENLPIIFNFEFKLSPEIEGDPIDEHTEKGLIRVKYRPIVGVPVIIIKGATTPAKFIPEILDTFRDLLDVSLFGRPY